MSNQPVKVTQVKKTYINDNIGPVSLRNSFDALSKDGDIFGMGEGVCSVENDSSKNMIDSYSEVDETIDVSIGFRTFKDDNNKKEASTSSASGSHE